MTRQVEPARIVLMPERPAASGALPASAVEPSASAASVQDAASVAQAETNTEAQGSAGDGSSAAAGSAPVSLAAGAPACLEAGPFGEAELPAIEASLAAVLNKGDWVTRTVGSPGVWLIYMGPFDSRDETLRKAAELRKLGLGFEEVRSPGDLAPGLSLGRYTEPQRAQERLAELGRKGIQTARVISASGPKSLRTVRLPAADARQSQALAKLPEGALRGKSFVPCASAPPLP